MGLLDSLTNLNPEQTQGLLAAAASMLQNSGIQRTPQSFGQIVGGGMQAYQQTTEEQRRRKLEEEQAAQQKALYGMKIRDAESDFKNQEIARERSGKLSDFYKKWGSPAGDQSGVAVSQPGIPQLSGAPQMSAPGMQLPQMPQQQVAGEFERMMAQARALEGVGFGKEAMDLRKQALDFREEYSTTPQRLKGPNGQLGMYQLGKHGGIRNTGLEAPPEMKLVDNGGSQFWEDQNAVAPGKTYKKTMTTSDMVSAANAAATRSQAERHFQARGANAAAKPLPTAALKMQQSSVDAIGVASGIQSGLSNIQQQMRDGKLDFGPVSNLVNEGRNMLGVSSEGSRNFASFKSNLEKLRNDSLRLNNGVQTDGDAQRAWNELFANINDRGVVEQRLQEIINLNGRAVQLHKLNIDNVRGNYGHEPMDTSKYELPVQPASQSSGGWSIKKVP